MACYVVVCEPPRSSDFGLADYLSREILKDPDYRDSPSQFLGRVGALLDDSAYFDVYRIDPCEFGALDECISAFAVSSRSEGVPRG